MAIGIDTPLLRVEHVCKRFGGVQVFDDVSFAVAPGEVLGVIGPNGAGKTTLINVTSGQLAPSAGRVLLQERDVTRLPMHARARLGLVRSFQQTKTFKQASVRENIERALSFSGGLHTAAADHIDSLLDRFDLRQHLARQSDKLAYGQQKLLGLLLTCATSPRILLLDEPAAGLEGSERTRIDDFVRSAIEHFGCGVLIVEHDMDLIKRLCTRALVLDGGRLVAEGAPHEVLTRPEVLAAYLGTAHSEADEEAAAC
ncbi:ABC transporter ATP-binding protein [Caballeronia sp. LZ065]|uniref:ABC transporter ATP-binding protein n=1 Tax=Caballeronia sp. LZ065 TaxID=3038571 RepID=UPI00285765C5|nr:ABC transporter ATP-binding protein [Caballeronia sp. LZ065]MDR5784622.1 ABC transporter ATP-binding protein [Caballeronia sp. LZ065]